MKISWLLLAILFCAPFFLYAGTEDEESIAYIAIIIDDLGYKPKTDQLAINLQGDFSYAFLPFAPTTDKLARQAFHKNRDIILHLPMQSSNNARLGPGGLTSEMKQSEFITTIDQGLNSVPYAKGINNHMGSYLTTQEKPMQWLMEYLYQHNLFFIDSRTTDKTIAEEKANSYQLFNTRRDVFLDHTKNIEDIQYQFKRLIKMAKKNGSAVGIAHPYKVSLDFLNTKSGQLKNMGIKLVSVTELIKIRNSKLVQSHPFSTRDHL